MLLSAFFFWWYGPGWASELQRVRSRVNSIADDFSVGLLASSLFAPFRQISVGNVKGPIGVQIRAFTDRLISRMIGAMIRSFMVVLGCIAIISMSLIGVVQLLLWPLVPLLVPVMVLLAIIGWTPF